MLSNLFQPKPQKALDAIKTGNTEFLSKLTRKDQWQAILSALPEDEDLYLIAAHYHQPESLRVLLEASVDVQQPHTLYLTALASEQSLSLLTHLLQHKINPPDNLWEACLSTVPDARQQMHLSRFFEYGVLPINVDKFLTQILLTNKQTLIYFAVSSFKCLPEGIDKIECDENSTRYAKRCLEDIRLREALSPF